MNWFKKSNDQPKFTVGDRFLINGKKMEIVVFLGMIQGEYWYILRDESKNGYYIDSDDGSVRYDSNRKIELYKCPKYTERILEEQTVLPNNLKGERT